MQARAASPLRRGPAAGEALRRGLPPGTARPLRTPAASPGVPAPCSRTLSSPAKRAALPSRQREGLPCPTSPAAPGHGTLITLSGGTTWPHQGGRRNSHVVQSLPLAVVGELVAIAATGGTAASSAVSPAHLGHLTISTAALTQLSLTAVAVAYGAYLSDGLLRHQGHANQPEPLVYHCVDVTEYEVFRTPEVQRAVEYAAMAHCGQTRRTGDPYVTHCIHTARIAAALAPGTSKRAVETVVAAVLHDVVDDTGHTLGDVEEAFGGEVARLVDGVSRLSYINQLLRRHRRTTAEQQERENTGLSPEDVDSLRLMLIGMINDPRVVLVKLADRLHNMRTIYALPEAKARAVAQETLSIWCSLASRLGVWAIKAELEDLCFAILQPHIFRKIRGELAAMWSSPDDWRLFRRRTRLRRYSSMRSAPPAPALLGDTAAAPAQQGKAAPATQGQGAQQPSAGGDTAAVQGTAVGAGGPAGGGERGPSTAPLPTPSPSPSPPGSSQPLLSAASAAAAELIRDFTPFRTPLSAPSFSPFSPRSSASFSSDEEEDDLRQKPGVGQGWRGGETRGPSGTPEAPPGPQGGGEYTVQDLVESVIPFHVLLNKTYRHTGSFWPSDHSQGRGASPGEAPGTESALSADETRSSVGSANSTVDQAALRAVHNVPTLPQLAQPSADSRGPGSGKEPRGYTGMQAGSMAGEFEGAEGAVREGPAQGGEGRGRRAKTRVMADAELALGALRKCEEQLQRELLLTTPYVPGMEVSLSGRLKSIYSCHAKMRRKGVGLDKIYDARALRVVVGDGGGRFQEAAVEACYNLLSVVHRLWTPIGGEFDDYILNPKPSGYQSLHTAVVGPDGAPLEVQIRTQMMHESAEFGHAAHWLYKESDMPPEAPASTSKQAPAAEALAGGATNSSPFVNGQDSAAADTVAMSGTAPSAYVRGQATTAPAGGESVAANASSPDASVGGPVSAAGAYRTFLDGVTAAGADEAAAGLSGGVSESFRSVPAAEEPQRADATSEGGPQAEDGSAQAQGSIRDGGGDVTTAQQHSPGAESGSSVAEEAGSARAPGMGEGAGQRPGSTQGAPQVAPEGVLGRSTEEWLKSSVRADPYGLLRPRLQPRSSGEQPLEGAAEGRGEPEAAGDREETSSLEAGKLPVSRGWGYRGAAAPPWEDEYSSEGEDDGGPAAYPGGSRPSRRLLQFPVPGSSGKLVMEGHPALRVAEGRLLSSVVMKVEAGGSSLLVAVSFALRAREAVSRGMRGTPAQGGAATDGSRQGSRGQGAGAPGAPWDKWERWEGYARLFDKVDSTWWNAPGHGDWSTCLEQYELCSDGIYHKVDRFGRVLPTFIQLLDLSPSDVQDYQAIMDAVRGGGVLAPLAEGPPEGTAAGDTFAGDTPAGTVGERGAWEGGQEEGEGVVVARQQALGGAGVGVGSKGRGGVGGGEGEGSGDGVPTAEGQQRRSSLGPGDLGQQPGGGREEGDAANITARINNKVRLLRSMLQWERELRHEAAPDGTVSSLEGTGTDDEEAEGVEGMGTAVALTEVLVVRWPGGDIVRLPGGSCTEVFVEVEERREGATAASRGGDAGGAPVVLVNGRPADPKTPLQDGDLVEIRRKV